MEGDVQDNVDKEQELNECKWYVVSTIPGHENKARSQLITDIQESPYAHLVEEVFVPSVSIKTHKRGKMVMAEKNIMPGYIFIKMSLEDSLYNLVKKTQNVINFLGHGRKPSVVPQSQIDGLKSQIAENEEKEIEEGIFRAGEVVRIFTGPFATFSGIIQDVDVSKEQLNVLVSIFGRETPIKLAFNEVEKIS